MEPIEYERMFELEDHHWWFQGRFDLMRRMVRRHSPPPVDRELRLLDIGCGTGLFLEDQSRDKTTCGLDFSRQAIKLTRGRGVERLVCADSEAIPFAAESFDLATAFDLVEHVEGDRALIAEAHRALRPGGIFLVTVPAHPFLWGAHDVALHHKRRYRWDQFDRLFDPKLWIKRRMTWTFSLIYPFAALIRLGRRILPESSNPTADTNLTPQWLNETLIRLHRLENAWAETHNLPFGLSIMTIREKIAPKEPGGGS